MEIVATNSQSTTSNASQSNDQLFEDYEAFLQLLTTQLQHQDPLDPMDTAEYTDQLTQYAILEQNVATNDNLEQLIGLTTTSTNTAALQYIGQTAEIDSNYAMLSDGSATWSYSPSETTAEVSLIVRDQDGRLVYEESGETGIGEQTFFWDGQTNRGDTAANGIYSLEVIASDRNGEAVATEVTSFGEVTGVDTTDGDVVYVVGELRVSEAALLGIGND